MALRNLATQSMISVSLNWVDPRRERPIIERYPIARSVVPRLLEVHGNLLAFQRASLESQTEIAEIQKQQVKLDAEHDRKIRGVHGFLTSLAELSTTERDARRYLDLRDRLLPEGLRAITRSYEVQGGEIEMLKARLDANTLAALRAIPTPDGPLLGHVRAWMDAGIALRDLDQKRTDIAKTLALQETRQADVARARNEWIRVAHALRANLALDRASEDDVERIFRYLDQAEAKADRRSPPQVEAPKVEIPEPPPAEAPSPCDEAATSNEPDP